MTVLQFPHFAGATLPYSERQRDVEPSGDERGLTALETYLEDLITNGPARLRARARRISATLLWHDVEVLTDPRHVPGHRRGSRLWYEIDISSRRTAPASHRMLARTVQAHLGAHERTLLADNLFIDVREYDDDYAPTPA